MKLALISPNEVRYYQTGWDNTTEPPTPVMDGVGWRVAQVEPVGQSFEVALPMFWTECEDIIQQDKYIYTEEAPNFHQEYFDPNRTW